MRSWPGFLIVAIAWSGCGRLGLDQPIEPGSGAAGDGAAGTGGRVGSPGAAGTSAAGSSGGGAFGTGGAAATGGRGGVVGSGGSAGAGGAAGAGATGVGGRGGAGATGSGGRGGVDGMGGTTLGGRGGRGGEGGTTPAGSGGRGGMAGTTPAGSGGRGGAVGTGGTGAAGTGGRGGTTGTAGAGGAGAGTMTCVPGRSEACTCSTGATGAQVCRADGTFDRCICASSEFLRIRDGMVGTWMGKQSNPWIASYQVRITFTSDGRYSGHCAQASCPSAVFYYGSDEDTSLKTYNLIDLHQDGTAYGRIALYFGLNNANSEILDEVFVSLDGQHLTFQFWNGDYGPLVFDLMRET